MSTTAHLAAPASEARSLAPRFPLMALGAWLVATGGLWLTAFAPLSAPPPWLGRLREVCFGSTPSGLPDTSGWISLVMGPLSLLAFLVAVWGSELLDDLRWMTRARGRRLLLIAGIVLPLIGLGWVARRVGAVRAASTFAVPEAEEPLPVHYPRGDSPAPALRLIDQEGAEIDLADFRGRPVIVAFAYAHCTTVCPVIVETVRTAARTSDESPAVLFVTLDPWRDTPSTLGALHELWALEELDDAHVLSGEVEAVTAVHEAWEIPTSRDPKSGAISHPALSWIVDGEGRLAYTFNAAPPAWLVEALARVD